jgi:hypothetical protein
LPSSFPSDFTSTSHGPGHASATMRKATRKLLPSSASSIFLSSATLVSQLLFAATDLNSTVGTALRAA